MILWTVMPLELVFSQEEIKNPYEQINYAGADVMVERISDTERRIVRILSTDPQDFLRDDIKPGVVLTYKPVISEI